MNDFNMDLYIIGDEWSGNDVKAETLAQVKETFRSRHESGRRRSGSNL